MLGEDRAALGGRENSYIFDVNTGQVKGELTDGIPGGLVWCMSPSPGLRYLLTGGADQSMRIWKPDTNEPLVSLFVAGDEWVAWTPQDHYAASLGGEYLMGWHVNIGLEWMASFYPAARFRNSLYRPDIIRRLIPAGSRQEAHAQADLAAARITKPIVIETTIPPAVKISVSHPSDTSTVAVQATATPSGDAPVTSMLLLVDGRPQGASQMVTTSETAMPVPQQHPWNVDLPPGEHRLSVRADTDKSDGIGEVPTGIKSPGKSTPGKLYMLAVGVSVYQQPALRLAWVAADAQSLAEIFPPRAQPLFTKVETRLFKDADATRGNLVQSLARLRKRS